ncbi:hypothetical protein [Chroococcidiopsis sp. TS-821]|uniref:hypothetical protein n=1 Tax=Chroococcidiopsis sp. TS-821 TaxID=1378066 RepID=UPI000CEE2605|nr:hypothetical protein [Chroococcidiopsis sp. TS-821]PPS42738.1 hypothetical protein B1A85_13555 [Chroococcidiopsis sp. TS-821]
MLKKFVGVVLGATFVLPFHLIARADDTQYPIPFQNYLSQLARESDWIREGPGNKHYHFISFAPTGRLIALSNTTCKDFQLGKTYETVKAGVVADSKTMFPTEAIAKLGSEGVGRFADVAIKSAVANNCTQFSSSLPQLNYILPQD